MKGIVGATMWSLGLWCFGFGIFFSSPTLIVMCAVFLALGCWVAFGSPVPEEDRDDDDMV